MKIFFFLLFPSCSIFFIFIIFFIFRVLSQDMPSNGLLSFFHSKPPQYVSKVIVKNVTGIEKPRGQFPSPGSTVLVRRALLPPAACRQAWRGYCAGLAAVGHQVCLINIPWASEIFLL